MTIQEEGQSIISFLMFSPRECADALARIAKRPPRWKDSPLG